MSIQSSLKKFNDKIKMDFDEKKELADKRDILLSILEKDSKLPSFYSINQGSYAMYTGIKPVDGNEYDIDVALIFKKSKNDDCCPMDIKLEIKDLLENHTDYGAVIKNPCVTVKYKKGGELAFHIDLVVYLPDDVNDDSQLYIVKGKNNDSEVFEKADPKGLVDYITNKINKGEERDQVRRLIRYLKKWKIEKFADGSDGTPPSIGLTLLSIDNFIYHQDNDLEALIQLVNEIKSKFTYNSNNGDRQLYRLSCYLPSRLKFENNTDVFKKMSDIQMTDFKDKLEKLHKDLCKVNDEPEESKQYEKLKKIFGDDFEIPGDVDTAKKQCNYIPPTSASGSCNL